MNVQRVFRDSEKTYLIKKPFLELYFMLSSLPPITILINGIKTKPFQVQFLCLIHDVDWKFCRQRAGTHRKKLKIYKALQSFGKRIKYLWNILKSFTFMLFSKVCFRKLHLENSVQIQKQNLFSLKLYNKIWHSFYQRKIPEAGTKRRGRT